MDRIIENGEVLDHGWSSDYGWGSGGGYLSRSEKAVWTNGTMTYQYAVVEGVNYSDQSSDGYWDYSVECCRTAHLCGTAEIAGPRRLVSGSVATLSVAGMTWVSGIGVEQ